MEITAVEELESVEVEETETEAKSVSVDEITYIPVESIIVVDRKRDINDARVTVLADSIKNIGLLQPIVITKDYHLVAGLHRTGAFKKLGIPKIPAVFKEYSTIDAELAEIDENLVRFELTDMERSIQYKRRKEIYEHKYPQTLDNKKRQALREKWEQEGKPSDHPEIPDFGSEDAQRDDVKSFVRDTAEKTGRGTSQVRDEADLGKRLMEELSPEIRGLIAPTDAANNKSDLKRLLEEPDQDIRYEAAKAVRDSYDEWVESGANEKEKSKIVKLGDILSKLQAPATYENTVGETGEDTLHRTLQKTLKSLELSVDSGKFKEVAETWTYEGIDDLRKDFLRIEELAGRGASILADIMATKEKTKATSK